MIEDARLVVLVLALGRRREIPDELDRRLDELAIREHVSKHALLLQGAELIVRSRARREEVDRGIDFVLNHDAELLRRLEDA